MTFSTDKEIAERIRDMRAGAEDVGSHWQSAEGDAIRWRMLRAADALEALSKEREWKPIGTSSTPSTDGDAA